MIFVHFLIVFITRFFTIDSMRLYLRGKSKATPATAEDAARLAAEAAADAAKFAAEAKTYVQNKDEVSTKQASERAEESARMAATYADNASLRAAGKGTLSQAAARSAAEGRDHADEAKNDLRACSCRKYSSESPQ